MKAALHYLRRFAAIERVLPYRHALRLRLFMQKRMDMLEPETRLLKVLLSSGDHVIDVGTNAGIYTYLMSQIGCRVESFEPLAYYSSLLRSAGLPNVAVHDVALSDSKGKGVIHIPIIDGQPRRTRASIEETSDATIGQEIEFLPLDDFGFTDVSFIKIDVEGHELAVLRGSRATIERSKPALLVEIEQHRLVGCSIYDVFSWFEDLGYEGFFYRKGVRCTLNEFDVTRDQAHVDSTYKNSSYINNFIFLLMGGEHVLPATL